MEIVNVKSRLNEQISYKEIREIDDEDQGHKSPVFELDLFDEDEQSPQNRMTISVVIGSPKYTYSSKNVIFFRIYAVSGRTVRSQIGIFEIESSKLLNVYKAGELDPKRLPRPVLYSFVSREYLEQANADPAIFAKLASLEKEETATIGKRTVEPILEQVAEEDEFRLHSAAAQAKLRTAVQPAEIFEIRDLGDNKPPTLEEETEESAAQIRKEYVESARNNWIEQYAKNNHYKIHETESNGDCFFATVRDAFAQIGRHTTVAQMRALLAEEMDDTTYSEQRTLYLELKDNIAGIDREMKQFTNVLKEYEQRIKTNADVTTADTKKLIQDAKQIRADIQNLTNDRRELMDIIEGSVGHLEKYNTLEKMREYIKTSSYWADTWAISTIERLLNVKMIILSEMAFREDDKEGVLQCGELNKYLQEHQHFEPEFYIITTYSGNHYRLVSYKDKKILTFSEVPYDLKIRVLNKCVEKNAGPYYLIQDFRNMKSRFGMDEDEGRPPDYDDMPGSGEMFDPEIRFVFYARSDKSVGAGKGDGEQLPLGRAADYLQLNTKPFLDWRKKLDDEWDKTPIRIDGRSWTSVEHYMQAVKYKNGHPDVYLMFSIDGAQPGTDLATSVKTAKAFKGIAQPAAGEGEKKKRAKPISIDMDFTEEKQQEEREKALRAKFAENRDLGTILKATKRALLLHKEKPGSPLTEDTLLMRVRAGLP